MSLVNQPSNAYHNHMTSSRNACLTVFLGLALSVPAMAQPAKGAAKPAAKASAKPAVKTTTSKGVPKKLAKKVEAYTPVQTLSDRLTDAEKALAEHVQTGTIKCELGAVVTVKADEHNPGFFHVSTGKHRFLMHPVESRTGAMRLEDNRAGALWLQLANKSMLMDQKHGQRLADDCMTDMQQTVTNDMKTRPAVNLLEEGARAPQ